MMKNIKRISTAARWESANAYCRALKSGRHIYVSGTTAVDDQGRVLSGANIVTQTRRCLEIIANALKEFGADLSDIVRTRIYLTDISDWPEVGKIHKQYFAEHPPTNTLVEVSSLIHPDLLVEIEADAVCHA